MLLRRRLAALALAGMLTMAQLLPGSAATAQATSAEVAPDAKSAISYPTLDAAIAAQATEDTDEAIRCLATTIYFEAKGEPLAGQLAVAQVVLNRAAAGGRFGEGVCGVVTQPHQFSFVRGGKLPDVDAGRPAWRTAVAVAKVALAEAWDGEADRALYFNNRRVGLGGGRLVRVATIGNHIFYR